MTDNMLNLNNSLESDVLCLNIYFNDFLFIGCDYKCIIKLFKNYKNSKSS